MLGLPWFANQNCLCLNVEHLPNAFPEYNWVSASMPTAQQKGVGVKRGVERIEKSKYFLYSIFTVDRFEIKETLFVHYCGKKMYVKKPENCQPISLKSKTFLRSLLKQASIIKTSNSIYLPYLIDFKLKVFYQI